MLESIAEVLKSIIGSLAVTLVLLTVVYLIFWKLLSKKIAKKRIQLSNRVGWHQLSFEIKNTIISLLAAGVFTGGILYLSNRGYTKLYTNFGKYGWLYEVLIVFVLLLWSDTTFYWIHRWLHTKRMYKYIHAVHHESLDTSPYTSNSFHFLEPIFLTLAIAPLFFIFPISAAALGVTQVIGTVNNIKSHLGYEFFPAWFRKYWLFNNLVTSTHHNLHHTQYNGNYGLMIRFWDKFCGTELKDTDKVFDEIQQRKKVTITNNTHHRKLVISNIVHETVDVTSLYFEPTDAAFYNYYAGQYLDVLVEIDSHKYRRSFSLSSSPGQDKFLRITGKRHGIVTNWFADKAKIGDQIEALLPVGDFRLHNENSGNHLFVAGGSGITPLYAMIKTLLHQDNASKISLLYATKSADAIIFKDDLDTLQSQFPTRFNVSYFISGVNRLSQPDIEAVVNQWKDLSCYICGPVELKDSVKRYLADAGLPKEKLFTEDYADGYVSLLSALTR
ncbi:sterol desaturase family protein [Fibrella aquatilis]|uniref:Sterol desaturase family protein n=1 Tax=Fibrella aquatilis TaxID=2817059 RepID=A0A939K2N9_9BACT|nr:sterol desaturase family protein [Fibrella aquatilis]MBO0933505.1 sterol desaturase family protein [Fibrella aquatilis]